MKIQIEIEDIDFFRLWKTASAVKREREKGNGNNVFQNGERVFYSGERERK